MNKILILFLVLLLASCAPKSGCEGLQKENEALRAELEQYRKETPRKETPRKETPSKEAPRQKGEGYTDEEALGFVKDYYEFYRRDYKYRNALVRREGQSPNNFVISLEECDKTIYDCSESSGWGAEVRYLMIADDGSYNLLNEGEKRAYDMINR